MEQAYKDGLTCFETSKNKLTDLNIIFAFSCLFSPFELFYSLYFNSQRRVWKPGFAAPIMQEGSWKWVSSAFRF